MNSREFITRIESIAGNQEEINSMIEAYKPFIAACTQKVAGRFVRFGEDDELSIALCAFEKAIRNYSPDKGNFLTFAEVLIRNSIIDYIRKGKKHSSLVYLEDYKRFETEDNTIDGQMSVDKFKIDREVEERRLEIMELKKQLSKIEISFEDLENSSPKSKKTREICNKIILTIMMEQVLQCDINRTGQLPLQIIECKTGIKRKKFERHRKYILAIFIILNGEYNMLKEYIDRDLRIKYWGCKTQQK